MGKDVFVITSEDVIYLFLDYDCELGTMYVIDKCFNRDDKKFSEILNSWYNCADDEDITTYMKSVDDIGPDYGDSKSGFEIISSSNSCECKLLLHVVSLKNLSR